jgi:hypothetical protein
LHRPRILHREELLPGAFWKFKREFSCHKLSGNIGIYWVGNNDARCLSLHVLSPWNEKPVYHYLG